MAQYTFDKFNSFNSAPNGAAKIDIYDKDDNYIGSIPLGNLSKGADRGERLYRIGLISDIHVDTQDYSSLTDDTRNYWVGDEGENDLKRALRYFTSIGCDFVCSAGDLGLSTPSSELPIYQSAVAECAPNLPVFTCTGNHDVYSGNNGASSFNSYTRRSVETNFANIINSSAYQNTFYFEKAFGDGKKDLFIFFSMHQNTPTDGNAYLDADITWIDNLLKNNRNNRCFIFTHYFFPAYAGNLGRVKGASQGGMYGTNKALGGSATLESRFMDMLANYPNTIWFSGHTHWKYDLQKMQSNANIDRFVIGDVVQGKAYNPTWGSNGDGGAYTIHLSSLSSPLGCSNYSTSEHSSSVNQIGYPAGSEGAYMDVYENGVEFVGIDFNTENTIEGITDTRNMKLLPIANYWLDTTLKLFTREELDFNTWTLGASINSTSGDTESSAYAAVSDFIAVDSANRYKMTLRNVVPKYDSTSQYNNVEGYNSVTMYAYDKNKNYLGRIKGLGYCPNGLSNYQLYFDGAKWYGADGNEIDKFSNVPSTSDTIARIDDLIEYDITDCIFDNSGTTPTSSTKFTYTGDVAYIRLRVQFVCEREDAKYSALYNALPQNFSMLVIDNTGGEITPTEPIEPPTPREFTLSSPLQYSTIASMAIGESKRVAITSIAYDGSYLGSSNTSWSTSGISGFSNYGTGITSAQSDANEATLKTKLTNNINMSNGDKYMFILKKVGANAYNIYNKDGKYLSGTTDVTFGDTPMNITIENATGTSASSSVVTQNTPKVLRIKNSSGSNLYCGSTPSWSSTQSGGWTLYYMFEIDGEGGIELPEQPTYHNVTYTLSNISGGGASTIIDGGELSFTISANSGYRLPSSISVSMGGVALSTSAYTYNASNGSVSIPNVNGDVVVTATAEQIITYSVTQSGSGATITWTNPTTNQQR